MRRSFIFFVLIFISAFGFSQQYADDPTAQNRVPFDNAPSMYSEDPRIGMTGGIPDAADTRLYQIQARYFKIDGDIDEAFEILENMPLYQSNAILRDSTRVMIRGVRAGEVASLLRLIRNAGFSVVLVKLDRPPVSTAALPPAALHEVAYCSVKVDETKNLADFVTDKDISSWTSSTPSTVSVDSDGNITGQAIGSAYVRFNETEYISVVVVPNEDFYIVPEAMAVMLPRESRPGSSSTRSLDEYITEPTFRLSYRFNNKGENRGASGGNGGIDILGRGENYAWLWTTYRQGGWFYDLNGVVREMINGFQKDHNNGVQLTLKPEFVYDNGVPYLQLKHLLYNPNDFEVTDQRFGASADVMIHLNDHASLLLTEYGAFMTDSDTNPSLELMFICLSGEDITPVDTLWLGGYDGGRHVYAIYNDLREDVHNIDSAMGFSYTDISLAPGETKEFIVRFTLAQKEKLNSELEDLDSESEELDE